jgi:hypothetical protein
MLFCSFVLLLQPYNPLHNKQLKMLSDLPDVLSDIVVSYCSFQSQIDLSLVNSYFFKRIRKRKGSRFLSSVVKKELSELFDADAFCAKLLETNGHIKGEFLRYCFGASWQTSGMLYIVAELVATFGTFLWDQGYKRMIRSGRESFRSDDVGGPVGGWESVNGRFVQCRVYFKDVVPTSMQNGRVVTLSKQIVIHVFHASENTELTDLRQCTFDGRNVVVPPFDFDRMRKDYMRHQQDK